MPTLTSDQHPAIKYVTVAYEHIGPGGHAWVQSMEPGIGTQAWCAATQCAIAKTCGWLGTLYKDSWMAGNFGQGVIDLGGQLIPGPRQGQNSTPQPGDIILFHWGSGGESAYGANHVGVVYSCVGTTIKTVEGNTGNSEYKSNTYQNNNPAIVCYCRPAWNKLGASMIVPGQPQTPTGGSGGGGSTFNGQLYTTKSTRADASLREVGYWNTSKNKIQTTGHTRVAIINYTGMLSDFVKAFGLGTSGDTSSGGEGGTISGLNSVESAVLKELQSKGLNMAACIAVMANMKGESSFNLTALSSDGYGSIGLCQWTGGRKSNLMSMFPDWGTNIGHQVDFFWHEVSTTPDYAETLNALKTCPNTEQGALNACATFVRNFERPDNTSAAISTRQAFVRDYWSRVKWNTVSSGSGKATTQSGKTLTSGRTINIPSSVSQTGIIANFTAYDRGWAQNTNQRRVYDVWVSKGKKYTHGIATIDGMYLFACTTTFGMPGDVVSVVLQNGKFFNGIIGDSKGSGGITWAGERTSAYGHYFGNSVDVIEWEAVNSQAQLTSGLKQAGWYGSNVSKIVNYGSYFQ